MNAELATALSLKEGLTGNISPNHKQGLLLLF